MEDLRALSEAVCQVANKVIADAVRAARSNNGGQVYLSLFDEAKTILRNHEVSMYERFIVSELLQRPEIDAISIVDSYGKVSILCNPEYTKILGAKEPEQKLSMARMAEIGEKALEYVKEESKDPAQDLTERFGLSIEELEMMDPVFSDFDPLELHFCVEFADPNNGERRLLSFPTIQEAWEVWREADSHHIYAETGFGMIPLAAWNHEDGCYCISLAQALQNSGLIEDDLPNDLVKRLREAVGILSNEMPIQSGLSSVLTEENAVGQTMYVAQKRFYNELLIVTPMVCTGLHSEAFGVQAIQFETEPAYAGTDRFQTVVPRSNVMLTEEELLAEVSPELSWANRNQTIANIAVTKYKHDNSIVLYPLTSDATLGENLEKAKPGRSLDDGKREIHIFDVSDLAGAIHKTAELMRPYLAEPQRAAQKHPASLSEKIQDANERASTASKTAKPRTEYSLI